MVKKSSTKQAKEETKVTRITASDTKKKSPSVARTTQKLASRDPITKEKRSELTTDDGLRNPLAGLFGYFRGSWQELRQVRWPNRRSTWSMTGALLLFTGFFVVVILLLDAGFKYLFQILLGK